MARRPRPTKQPQGRAQRRTRGARRGGPGKALTSHPTQPELTYWWDQAGEVIDCAARVGDGLDSGVVMSPVLWIARNFPEAPLAVYDVRGTERELVRGHPLQQLIARPNPFYDGTTLWLATMVSWCMSGNAYWLVVRDGTLRPIALWFAPPWSIVPRWKHGGGSYVDWYDYAPTGTAVRLEPRDVIHLRNGINPRNVRLGLSPLAAETANIFSDDEAGRYTASLLHNFGVPGLVLSPDSDQGLTDDEATAAKAKLEERTTGSNRGRPIVLTGRTKVVQFGFSPKDLDVSALRNVSEERVCAALGLPAAIVGYGAGLEATKVGATMREMRQLAWDGCIIPNQRIIGQQLQHFLMPEFEPNPDDFEVGWDRSEVTALQEDQTAKANRWNSQVSAGYVMVSEARQAFGLDVQPADKVYLRSIAIVPEGPGAPELAPAATVVPPKGAKGLKRPGALQRAVLRRQARAAQRLERAWRPEVVKFFRDLGAAAAAAAQRVLVPKAASNGNGHDGGAKLETAPPNLDDLLTDEIVAAMGVTNAAQHFKTLYGKHYLRTYEDTINGLTDLGLVVDAPDMVARQVVAEGGRQAGLVDLTEQTREALFEALTEGRSAGEGPADLVRRVREVVPAGPWGDVETRSRVIARTETMHAQRYSALQAYQHAENVTQVMLFDNRTGYNDEDCSERDGQVVTFEEAQAAMGDEHPNGTLSFAPIVGDAARLAAEASARQEAGDA